MEQYERKKRRRKGKNPSHIYDRKGKIHHIYMTEKEKSITMTNKEKRT
jgi:hypothetical protein